MNDPVKAQAVIESNSTPVSVSGSPIPDPDDNDFEKNKLDHIFKNVRHDHKFQDFLKYFNGDEKLAARAIQKAAQKYVTENGIVDLINRYNQITVNVNGVNIIVRGNIILGVFRLGTAFIE